MLVVCSGILLCWWQCYVGMVGSLEIWSTMWAGGCLAHLWPASIVAASGSAWVPRMARVKLLDPDHWNKEAIGELCWHDLSEELESKTWTIQTRHRGRCDCPRKAKLQQNERSHLDIQESL